MLLCAFVTAWIFSRLLGRDDSVAWLGAAFMGVGYLTHLILDELYSVDVMDTRIKSSFGTALKLFDYRHLGHSAAMAIATALIFIVTPPSKVFFESITSRTLWTGLNQRLLPQEKWFGGMAWLLDRSRGPKAETAPAGASPIASGAVASPPPKSPKDGGAQ